MAAAPNYGPGANRLYPVIEPTKHSPLMAAASTAAGAQARTLSLKEMIVTSSHTIANPSQARGGANPALTAALAVTAIAAATLAGAWFFQLVLDIRPCPLCLEQRYAYYLAVPLGVLVAWAAARHAPRGMLVAGLLLLALAALANAWLGGYHAGVEWGFWQGPTECSGPVLDLGRAGSLFDNLDKVKVIRCDEVQWRFLGLSLAGYNVLISLAMAVIAAWGIAKSKRDTSSS
jgi:disulfide bond formation protein DsbB